eukprot:9791590-Alexandrium_andersonii.AAC.1
MNARLCSCWHCPTPARAKAVLRCDLFDCSPGRCARGRCSCPAARSGKGVRHRWVWEGSGGICIRTELIHDDAGRFRCRSVLRRCEE